MRKLLVCFIFILCNAAYSQSNASFSISGSKCLGDSVFFQFTGQGDSLFWDFDDSISGFLNTSNDSNVMHIFAGKGTFNVRLIVRDTNGIIDTVWQTWTVYNKPIANFTFINACIGLDAQFTNASLSDFNNPINSYRYLFGNGSTSNQASPQHAYASTGVKSVKLIVQTKEGCLDSIQKSLTVFAQPNVLLTTDSICPGDDLGVDIQHGTDSVKQYAWNLGDGSISNNKTF